MDHIEMMQQMETLAKDKIRCECGNADYTNFLYAGFPPTSLLAGCKVCGRTYMPELNGIWALMSGPGMCRPEK